MSGEMFTSPCWPQGKAMALSPTFDIEGYDDGIITRDRDVKDSAAIFFGAAVQ